VGVSRKITSLSSYCVNPLKKEGIKQLAKFDAEYFGANRAKVLSRLSRKSSALLCFT